MLGRYEIIQQLGKKAGRRTLAARDSQLNRNTNLTFSAPK